MSDLISTESLIRQVEEITVTQNIDGTDIDVIVELTTIPEGRVDGDYKVSIKLRKSHASADAGFDEECEKALVTAVRRAFEKGESNLKEYWKRNGGQQGNLFGQAKGKSKSDQVGEGQN